MVAGAVGLGGAAAGLAYGVLGERRWFALRHVTVPVLRAPTNPPLRLLHLSDLHLWPRQRALPGFLRRALALEPDVVVATGDLLGHPDSIDAVVELLGPAAEGRPALAVLGSNDHYGPQFKNPLRYIRPSAPVVPEGPPLETERLIVGLEASGWVLLDNRRAQLHTPAGTVDVAGLGDPHLGLDRPEAVDWSPPPTPVALRLGLVHAPYRRALAPFAQGGFDLVLAGHTHGGQVRLPLAGALVNNCDLPLGHSRGLSRHGPMWLHISAGLGTSPYAPIRFACRPEATVIDLVPRVT